MAKLRPILPPKRPVPPPLGPAPRFGNSVEHGDQRNLPPVFRPAGPPPRTSAPHVVPRPAPKPPRRRGFE